MKLLLFLLLLPLSFQLNAQTIVKHDIRGRIQDMATTTVTVENVDVERVGKIFIDLNVKHTDFGDLIINLVSPENKVFVLAHNNRSGSGKLKLRLNHSNRELGGVIGIKARGTWTVTIEDNKKRNVGTVTYLKFQIENMEDDGATPTNPTQPTNPTTPANPSQPTDPVVDLPGQGQITTDAQCKAKWDAFLAKRDLDPAYNSIKYLCNDSLVRQLHNVVKAQHHGHGYTEAREFMFSELDNVNGEVCGVYTGRCIRTRHIPGNADMNCEHTWPKSKGAGSAPAKMDLHHLFPTDSRINSSRSSYPFCEVETAKVSEGGSSLGSYNHITCFEPRDTHKGDVARAMMYFSVRYGMAIDAQQEAFFRKWNKKDGVSREEATRNIAIIKYQGNSNPFVEYPELSQLISNF